MQAASMIYLKEDSYYNDLYDLLTIKDCLSFIDKWNNALKRGSFAPVLSKLSPEDQEKRVLMGINYYLYFVKGERFRNKAASVSEWRERDRNRDVRLVSAREPGTVLCQHCNTRMRVFFKDLYDLDDNAERVLFFFECPTCNKRKGLFEDGKAFVSRMHRCAKCNGEINVSHKEEGKIETWISSCQSCRFIETRIEDREKKKAVQAEERELLAKRRDEFCLSSADGEKYIESMRQIENYVANHKEQEQKRADPDWQRVKNLKKLGVADLETLISRTIEKDKYTKLTLDKPEIDRYVIVPFTVQDSYPLRNKSDSVRRLRKIINTALEGTNWRLMSEDVNYRLGYLSGRLKGYEREEDLLQMMKGRREGEEAKERLRSKRCAMRVDKFVPKPCPSMAKTTGS